MEICNFLLDLFQSKQVSVLSELHDSTFKKWLFLSPVVANVI